MRTTLTEKEFLTSIALLQFNLQFKKKFLVEECDIVTIPANSFSNRGYEITSLRLDDLVRMRIYVTFGTEFHASPYRLETTGEEMRSALGDEVYVSDIKIPSYYKDEGIYKFRTLLPDYTKLPVFLAENGVPFLSEGYLYFLPEKDPVYEGP